MNETAFKKADEALGKMDLKQKVGQLFTQAFYGSIVTPDVVKMIKELNCGGLRVTQFYRQFLQYARPGAERAPFDRSTPSDVPPQEFSDIKDTLCKPPYLSMAEYAEVLNQLKEIAAERPYDAPLHLCLDQEGDQSFDFVRGGPRFFPNPWGLARAGDRDLMYESCRAIGRQLSAVGFNCIHSPVVDVVLNPANSYIGVRGFGSDPEFVAAMGEAATRGFMAGGVMPCGKHFPGRGSTDVDDHHDVGSINRSRQEMWEVELLPYRRLIAAGLPMIMVAHSVYPAYDERDLASCSEKILQGLARGELGFKGIITTDSVIMGAIAKKYGIPDACVLAVKAGSNLILMKECGPIRNESYRRVMEAVEHGEIPESHVDQLVRTTLHTKARCGLYGDDHRVAPAQVATLLHSDEMGAIEQRAAHAAVHVLRDRAKLLPLTGQERVLLVEQIAGPHLNANDRYVHPGIFWDQFLALDKPVGLLEVGINPSDEDRRKALQYMEHFDIVVATHYTGRSHIGAGSLIQEIIDTGKRVIVVANSPLPDTLPDSWPTVVCAYGAMPPMLKRSAELIYGD
jgi:beta-N-acetylhexosaminidase